jgi:hypothetical protein
MKNKKFELTAEKKEVDGIILFRIKALVDLKFCKANELGGWIEKESNLDLFGTELYIKISDLMSEIVVIGEELK